MDFSSWLRGMRKRLAAYLSHRPVALQIGALVAATTLPLIGGSAFMFHHLVEREHERTRESLMLRARTLAALVDSRADTFEAIGWALAGSSQLRLGDLEGFSAEAAAAMRHMPGSWVTLSRLDGRAVLTTKAPPGVPLQMQSDPEIIRRAVKAGKPQLIDLAASPMSNTLAPFVEVPVPGTAYSIEVVLNPSEFLSLFETKIQNGEIVGLLDRNLRFIARIPDHAARLGTPPSPGWRAAIQRAPEGWTETLTLEGTPTITAYARTDDGWTVGIGEPSARLTQAATKILWTIAATALALLGLSALLAWLIATRITKGMRALTLAASHVGRGAAVEPSEAPFAEARSIGSALAKASEELKRRGELLARDKEILEAEVASRTAELRREMALKSEVEEQLLQSQKMEALGQLAGGIAHDFNNMLAVIVASLQLVKRRLDGSNEEKLGKHIGAALSAADRAASLTRRLLAFSRQQPLEPAVIDINGVIRDLSDFLQRTLGSNITLETRLAGDLWPVNIDPRQFELAIVNLAVNARDAMESGGKLLIETHNSGAKEGAAEALASIPAPSVVVTVADTGTGMESETLSRAFEPFFTTKPVGKGTGLGLSQVQGFTQQSGGGLVISSSRGEGTTITLRFPRHAAASLSRREERDGPIAAPKAETGELVLIVEDEDQVRALVVEALDELGYATREAHDAESALAAMAEAPKIDLLLTDIVMPGMNGRDLARAARAAHPDLRVLYMTGYARSSVMSDRYEPWEFGALHKPFTFEQLAAAVRRTLDRAESVGRMG